MTRAARQHDTSRPCATRVATALLVLLLLSMGLLWGRAARAAEPEITNFELMHNEEGVLLNYAVDLELSRSVDDALSKAVPLFFVA